MPWRRQEKPDLRSRAAAFLAGLGHDGVLMPVAPTWFDTVGRSDDEEWFLGVLRAAEPLWRELDIEGPDAGVVCGETGPLMAYIDLTEVSGIYRVLRVDFLGDSIVEGDPRACRSERQLFADDGIVRLPRHCIGIPRRAQ